MSFDKALADSGSFKNLFETMQKSGRNVKAELEELLREESGLFAIAGFSITKLEDGYAELSFPFAHEIARHGGKVHGGVISYALDSVGGIAVMTRSRGIDQVTLELKVNFIEPLQKGPFRAEGRVLRTGRVISVAEAEVRDVNDKLCAKSIGTWYTIYSSSERRTNE